MLRPSPFLLHLHSLGPRSLFQTAWTWWSECPVAVGLFILKSAIVPATLEVTATPAVKETRSSTPFHSQTVRHHPICGTTTDTSCDPLSSQDMLHSPVVVLGCSLATHLLDRVFVLFAGLGCTDCMSVTSEGSFTAAVATIRWHIMPWPEKWHALPLGL